MVNRSLGRIFMTRNDIFWIAGVFLLSALPRTAAAQTVNQDFARGKRSVKNILILPPKASLMKSGMKGASPLVAESQAMELGLASVVGQALSDRGCNILPSAFNPEALDQNPDLKYALSDLQTRYDKLEVLLKKKPKGVRTGRFSLGDEVADFTPGATANALVFVRAQGFVPTTGLKTFVVVTGMGFTMSHAKLDISVADIQTGTILYFVQTNVYGNFIGRPDSMKGAIGKSLSSVRYQD